MIMWFTENSLGTNKAYRTFTHSLIHRASVYGVSTIFQALCYNGGGSKNNQYSALRGPLASEKTDRQTRDYRAQTGSEQCLQEAGGRWKPTEPGEVTEGSSVALVSWALSSQSLMHIYI